MLSVLGDTHTNTHTHTSTKTNANSRKRTHSNLLANWSPFYHFAMRHLQQLWTWIRALRALHNHNCKRVFLCVCVSVCAKEVESINLTQPHTHGRAFLGSDNKCYIRFRLPQKSCWQFTYMVHGTLMHINYAMSDTHTHTTATHKSPVGQWGVAACKAAA